MLALIVLMLCVPAVGCKGTATTEPSATSSQSGALAPEQTKTQIIQEKPSSMTFAMGNKPLTLYPPEAVSASSFWIFDLIYSPLIQYSDGEEGFQPGIVTEWTERADVDDPGYDLTITDKAVFSDGSKVTPEDVAYSIEAKAFSEYADTALSILKSVEIVDNTHIRLHFTEYVNNFLPSLVTIWVFPKAYYEKVGIEGMSNNPIGSGPYLLSEVDDATGNMTFTRVEDYWGEPGKLETIYIRIISEPNSAIIALENGEVNFYPSDIETLHLTDNSTTVSQKIIQTRDMAYMLFNTTIYPSNIKEFRQAIAYAIDYDTLVAVAGGQGAYVDTVFWLDEWGKRPDNVREYSYDPEKAKELLAQAGIETPIDLGAVQCMPSTVAAMEVLQQNFADVGINIKVEQVESGAWITGLIQGDYIINLLTGNGMLSEPAGSYGEIFNGGATDLTNGYVNEELFDLIHRMKTTRSKDEMIQLGYQALNIIQEELPYLRVFQTLEGYGYTTGLHVPDFDGFGYHLRLDQFYWK